MNIESQLFDQIDLIVFILGTSGRFIALNANALNLFGGKKEYFTNQNLHMVLDPYSYEKADEMIARTLEFGGVKDWELDHVQPDREPVLVGYTTCVLRDASGVIKGIGAVGRDLTKKLELTAQLAETNQKLEGTLLQLEKTHLQLKNTQAQLLQSEKMRALGQMVAGVAHEINNPLGFIRNNIAFLDEKIRDIKSTYSKINIQTSNAKYTDSNHNEKLEQESKDLFWGDIDDAIQESLDGVDRIQEIVLSLRNFSRLDEADIKEADINEGLKNTVHLVQPMCKDNIAIDENYGAIPRIVCHPGEINQVFLNLITNAIQAIEEEGLISVSTVYDNGVVIVKIKDSGMGMDQQTLSKLGEPFFTTKPIGTGVGLGLAVSFGIIQRHNGKLLFESSLAQGTTATIELPI